MLNLMKESNDVESVWQKTQHTIYLQVITAFDLSRYAMLEFRDPNNSENCPRTLTSMTMCMHMYSTKSWDNDGILKSIGYHPKRAIKYQFMSHNPFVKGTQHWEVLFICSRQIVVATILVSRLSWSKHFDKMNNNKNRWNKN